MSLGIRQVTGNVTAGSDGGGLVGSDRQRRLW